jgi:hypothetical protein
MPGHARTADPAPVRSPPQAWGGRGGFCCVASAGTPPRAWEDFDSDEGGERVCGSPPRAWGGIFNLVQGYAGERITSRRGRTWRAVE